MTQANVLILQSGEHSDIVVGAAMADELHCLSGSARIVNHQMGIGWFMRAGEGCILRAATRYHVIAQTKLRMSVECKKIPFKLTQIN